jgi:sugar phosphate isomerase/epimerase
MTPKFSVVQFTTPGLSFAEDLEVFAAAGAEGVCVCESKLSGDGDDREALAQLHASGLRASSFFPACATLLPTPHNPGAETAEARIADVAAAVPRGARFGAEWINLTPGPYGSIDHGRARALVVDGIRRIARVAADHDMKVGVELMHPTLFEDYSFITTIPEVVDLMEEVDEPNLGIALDAWHLSEGPEVAEQISEQASRILAFHLNDRRDPTRSWCDRVLPGDGTVDLVGAVRALEDAGYDGWYEFEVVSDDGRIENDFPDSLWKLDPLELITAGREKFLRIWDEARAGAAI